MLFHKCCPLNHVCSEGGWYGNGSPGSASFNFINSLMCGIEVFLWKKKELAKKQRNFKNEQLVEQSSVSSMSSVSSPG